MSGKEHFWIPDSEKYTEKHNPIPPDKEPRADRGEHSKALRGSLSKAVDTGVIDRSSFRHSDVSLVIVELDEGVNAHRQDSGLGDYYMDVKAVLDDTHILASVRKRDVEKLDKKIEAYPSKSGDSVLDQIKGFRPNTGLIKCSSDVVGGLDGSVDVVVTLVPNMSDSDYEGAMPLLEEAVSDLDGQINGSYWEPGEAPFFSVTLPSEKAVLSMCDDTAVYHVSKDGRALPVDAFFLDGSLYEGVRLDETGLSDGMPVVCVIDNGIGGGFLEPLVCERMHPERSADDDHHGGMVASRAAFGYVPQSVGTNLLVPVCRLIDCNVYHEFENMTKASEVLREIVSRYHEVCRVYNLSINFDQIDSNSELSMAMDVLQRQYDVLFVISAGNHSLWCTEGLAMEDIMKDESSRILVPGLSVLGVTVGSAVSKSLPGSISSSRGVAPYSRHGPGTGGMMKPDVLAYTADVQMKDGGRVYSDDETSRTLRGDLYAKAVGTSFAAPVVSSMLAVIGDRFSNLSILAAKTLLLHRCRPVDGMDFVDPYGVGCGIVGTTMKKALESDPKSLTFIREDVLSSETNRHCFRIMVPEDAKGSRRSTITVTCCSMPVLDRSRGSEYIGSYISATLWKPNDGELIRMTPKESIGGRGHPYLKRKYRPKTLASGDYEVRLELSSAPNAKHLPVRYVLAVSVDLDSTLFDIHDAVGSSGRYQLISEIDVRNKIEQKVTVDL